MHQTTTLPAGVIVLAKLYRGELSGKTFANRTQAEKSAAACREAGLTAWVWQPRMGPVFYVRIDG